MYIQLLRFEQGVRGPYPTAAEVATYQFGPEERARLRHHQGRVVSGTPAQVRAQLTGLVAAYEAEELLLTSITADFADRLRACELLAEAFELKPTSLAVTEIVQMTWLLMLV